MSPLSEMSVHPSLYEFINFLSFKNSTITPNVHRFSFPSPFRHQMGEGGVNVKPDHMFPAALGCRDDTTRARG